MSHRVIPVAKPTVKRKRGDPQLLVSRALIAAKTCMDYHEWDYGKELIEKIAREYSRNPDLIKSAFAEAIKYLCVERYEADLVIDGLPKMDKPSDEIVKKTEELIAAIVH